VKQVVFLSMDDIGDFYVYDDLLHAPLANVGWQVTTLSWRADVDWSRYDAVVVRSTWDYQQHSQAFLQCLRHIDASETVLENALPVIEWNIEKTYLKALAEAGVHVVPTCWCDTFDLTVLESQFAHFDSEELIIKPVLSANADDTFRLKVPDVKARAAELRQCFASRSHMIQPFIGDIVSEGEYSLFYFGNEYSHSILKKPAAGDFRVQEEHGGQLAAYEPDEAMLSVARAALDVAPAQPLYARVDLVRFKGNWAVMEMELIEPSLYFNMDIASPKRFVQAFVQRFGRGDEG